VLRRRFAAMQESRILSALQISIPRLAAVVALIRQVRGEIHDQSNGRAIGLTDTGRGPELSCR
jgi:hypothetical protein